jgi:hypothetical protein
MTRLLAITQFGAAGFEIRRMDNVNTSVHFGEKLDRKSINSGLLS